MPQEKASKQIREANYQRLKGEDDAAATGHLWHKKDEGKEEKEGGGGMKCFLITIILILVLGTLDALTTKYFKRMCIALATWTSDILR